ncbi:sugar transferase [Candidatus Foliamicus sp.]
MRGVRIAGEENAAGLSRLDRQPLSAPARNCESGLGTDSAQPRMGVTAEQCFRPLYKRPFDLTVIFLAAILLAPVWLLVCLAIPLAIWLEDRGPVIYRQTRLGQGGRSFEMFKFRTMVVKSEDATGAVFSSKDDPRVTRVGRILRDFNLDEIPQIVNIIKGEMSLVGPRPERPELARLFGQYIPELDLRLRVQPGIAGLAQARGGYHATPIQKYRYDNLYIAKLSPVLDMKLLVWCFLVAIKVCSGRTPRVPLPADKRRRLPPNRAAENSRLHLAVRSAETGRR